MQLYSVATGTCYSRVKFRLINVFITVLAATSASCVLISLHNVYCDIISANAVRNSSRKLLIVTAAR